MATNGTTPPLTTLRRLETPDTQRLIGLAEMFEELQTVLRCCERLVSELDGRDDADTLAVEAVWTLAVLSYARCFSQRSSGVVLGENDLAAALPDTNVLDWHGVLLRIRELHAGTANPRETFSVGVAQDGDGSPGAVGITSARTVQVDLPTVRQTGAIAYALCQLLDERITAQQKTVLEQAGHLSNAELDALTELEVMAPDDADGTR